MAYSGLTDDQRAQVEDACERMLRAFEDQLRQDDDTAEDVHLRAAEIATVMLGLLDEDRTERVVALRWPDRDGGPIPWRRLEGPPTGLGRGGPESKWKTVVVKRAASAAPSCYSPAATAAAKVGGDA